MSLVLGVVAVGILGAARLASSGHQSSAYAIATVTPSPTDTPQPPISAAPISLAVVGASDAFGIGTDTPQTEAWPFVLAHDLSSNAHLLDLGIPGATVELAARDQVPVAVAAQPDLIAIFLGVNDLDNGVSLATLDAQLRAAVRTLRSGTSATIFIANLPDLTLLPYFAKDDPAALSAEVADWNADIAAICSTFQATLVDIHAAWSELSQHPEYISADGLHPSPTGAQRIAQAFFAAIEGTTP